LINLRSPQTKAVEGVLRLALILLFLPPLGGKSQLQNSSPHLPPELNRIPDRNQADQINGQTNQRQSFNAANAARRKRLDDDTMKLLKLAVDLKTEIDETGKDVLSLNDIKQVEEIEKLAHRVGETMKLTVGSH
jgi:hypothetical protein